MRLMAKCQSSCTVLAYSVPHRLHVLFILDMEGLSISPDHDANCIAHVLGGGERKGDCVCTGIDPGVSESGPFTLTPIQGT